MMRQAPILMVVTDPAIPDLMDRLAEAIEGGARLIQYRDKTATTEQRIRWVREFRKRFAGALVVVNDDLHAVLGSEADGLHMSASYQCDAAGARPVGPGRLLGRSIHDHGITHAQCRACDPDYLLFGTVYPSRSHPGAPVAGLDALKHAAENIRPLATRLPLIAIGGIDETNAADCIRAGAAGVAVIRSILLAPDPATAAANILKAMREAL